MNPMNMASMNPMAGGPVGMPMMNNGTGPPQRNDSDKQDEFRTQLNTYIYEYFLRTGQHDCARSMVRQDVPIKTQTKTSPSRRRDGDMNGIDENSMDTDSKDDMIMKLPEDLPRPDLPTDNGGPFLLEWFSLFWDIYRAQRTKVRGADAASQYVQQTQNLQRVRAEQQQHLIQQPRLLPGQMNQFAMGRMANGMIPNDLQKRAMQNNQRNLTPQQMAALANKQQMMQHQMQRENSDMDINGHRPQSPASAENAPSPSKRPRLEGGQFNGQSMPPGGRGQGLQVPVSQQQNPAGALLMQNGINPQNLTPQQFASFQSQNPQVQQKSIQVYAQNLAQHHQRSAMNNQAMAPKGMMTPSVMPNQGSPMMPPLSDGQNMGMPMNEYYASNPTGMPMRAMQGAPGGQGGNHALQDYQMQLMLLEQQNKKRLMMARQEQDSMNRTDGQPMVAGQQPLATGMSPQGSRSGPSPNPSDQMKRGTPKMGQTVVPGSPGQGDGMPQGRGSPAAMNFGGMAQDMGGGQFMGGFPMKNIEGMGGPNGVNMRPPSSNPGFNQQMNAPMEAMRAQQAGGRMPSGSWQQGPQGQMMGQPPQGQQAQNLGTPQERNTMPPPQAPPAGGANAGRTQPSSPQQNAPATTPSQTNKPNPKKKAAGDKDGNKKRPAKKASAVQANAPTPSSEAEPPPTPTPSTPITPQHPASFNNQKGPNAAAPATALTSAPVPQGPPPPQNDPAQLAFSDMGGVGDPNFNLDFSNLDTGDVLENFDFDSFLNTDDQAGFSFDPTMSYPDGVEATGDV